MKQLDLTVASLILLPATFLLFAACRLGWLGKRSRCLHVDDFLVFFGMAFALGLGIMNTYGTTHGAFGDLLWSTPDKLSLSVKLQFIGWILHIVTAVLVKLAIVIWYRRLSTTKPFSIMCISVMVVILCWGITFFFTRMFACQPIYKAWQVASPGFCMDYGPILQAKAVSNLMINTTIICAPVWTLWHLRGLNQQKAVVYGVYLLSLFSFGVSGAIITGYFPYNLDINHPLYVLWPEVESFTWVICAIFIPILTPILLEPEEAETKPTEPYHKAELHANDIPRPPPTELGGAGIQELEAPWPELAGTEQHPELPHTHQRMTGSMV